MTHRSSAPQRATILSTSIPRQAISPTVDAALRALPSHGWSHGWTGRRDRALLVLSQLAGLSFQAIAELTVADITIADGVAVISTPGGSTTLRGAEDGRICGPCALARWVHALDLASIYPDPAVVTAVIARAAPLTARSPHLCEGGTEVAADTRSLLVMPSIDQWGPCTPVAPRTARRSTTDQRPSTPELGTVELAGERTGKFDSAVVPRHLNLVRSNYSRADRERTGDQAELLAETLADRADALLQHRTG